MPTNPFNVNLQTFLSNLLKPIVIFLKFVQLRAPSIFHLCSRLITKKAVLFYGFGVGYYTTLWYMRRSIST